MFSTPASGSTLDNPMPVDEAEVDAAELDTLQQFDVAAESWSLGIAGS